MHHLVDTITSLLDYRLFGNSLAEYAATLASMLAAFLIVKLCQRFFLRRLRAWTAAPSVTWDDMLVAGLETNIIPALYALILYLGLRDLDMRPSLRSALHMGATIAVTVLGIRMTLAIVKHAIQSHWRNRATDHSDSGEKKVNGIITMAKIVVWILGGVLLLDNLGIKVSAFVAGLGITGIAVALAAQTILGDLFAYFVIFFDQPFEVGHSIKVDGFSGEVEHIGLKTTRLRGLDGEQVVISNKHLTDSRLQNFKRMTRRRATLVFDLDASNTPESLGTVPGLARSQLARHADSTFERAHVHDLTSTGLRCEIVFFAETANYGRYMDIRQDVVLALHREFRKAGLRLAQPVFRVEGNRGNRPMAPGDSAPQILNSINPSDSPRA